MFEILFSIYDYCFDCVLVLDSKMFDKNSGNAFLWIFCSGGGFGIDGKSVTGRPALLG